MDKFTELLQGSIYAPLVGHQERLVGRPTIVANEATLLVTVINESGLPSVFRFILRRQDSDPFEHCWMTTAVIPSMQFGGGPLDQPDLSASGIRTVDKNRPNERHDGE
ncbi:hypothetical protein [Stieleria sp.]|uniref:hypothetical protein n=1 Tax=Stieleria sp. TaxID=2795976 RepID=UPI0035683A8E